MEQRMLRPTAPSTSCACPLAGRPHPAEPGRGAVAAAGPTLRPARGVAEAARPLRPASSVAEATTNPNQPKAESKQQTTRVDTGRREEDRDPRPRPHATPSPLLRTASRYKQISLHAVPTALPLRRSPGWFLLSALVLSACLSCSWRLMDAGRAPTFSSDGGLALLFFFIYMFL